MEVRLASSAFRSSCETYAYTFLGASNVQLATSDNLIYSDLLILPGGEDISPEIYGQPNTTSGNNPSRDAIELLMLAVALRNKIPILGFCRGHQLINAYVGGTLTQQISPNHGGGHSLDHTTNDVLVQAITEVNSMHHQGVVTLADGVIGLSAWKGVWEITKSYMYRFISTQFHPEFGLGYDNDIAVANLITESLKGFRKNR